MLSKNKLYTLFDSNFFNSLGEAILLIDKEYNVIGANNSFKKAFRQKSVGNKCFHLIGRSSPCQICTCSQSSKKNVSQEKEEDLNGKHYLVSSNMISKSLSYDSFYIETYQDITYNKNLEESLLSKNITLENNLNIARQVQQSLLPQPIDTDKMKFTYKYLPCEKLGGDFFNLYRIDEHTYGIFIADVSGHGVSAAMLTMFLNSSYNKSEKSPSKILTDLFSLFNINKVLKNHYITIFYAVYDTKNKQLTYCNAGLNSFPVIFDSIKKEIHLIESSGFPISNWIDDPRYEDKTITIQPGGKILFYTDGITEAKNKAGIQYGQDRLFRSLIEGNPSTKITLDRIVSYLEDYIDDDIKTLNDDISLLIMESSI